MANFLTDATFVGDLTVSGGDITLGSTGRIQGIDTVSAGTDAANKTYVDTKILTRLPLVGGTMTGNITLNGDSKLLKFTPTSYDDIELGVDSNGFVIYNTTDSRYDLKISGTGNSTFAGDVTIADSLKSTGQNLKFHAAGTHVMNIDVNGKVYPNTNNAYDLGHSASLAWRNLFLSGSITSGGGATFAGKVNVAGSSNNQSALNVKTDSGSIGSIGFETGSEITGIISSATDVMDFRVGDGVGMGSARKLRIDTDGLRITGTTSISSIANATGDPDKFLCVNGNGFVQYRTGTQVRSDIGAGTSSTTGTVTNVTASTASGLDGLSVSSGTTTPVVGLDITGMGAYADGFTDGSIDYSQVFVPLCDDDNGGGNKKTNIRDLLAVNDKSLVVLNANFSDDSSTTSYLYVPYNTTSETTSAQYYVHWAAPHTGRFKRVVMQHVYGSMSSSFTTQLKITKNGLSTTTSSELTPSNGTSDGSYIEFNPSGNNVSFVKGDRFTIAYQKSASSKYWRGVAFSVIIELDKI